VDRAVFGTTLLAAGRAVRGLVMGSLVQFVLTPILSPDASKGRNSWRKQERNMSLAHTDLEEVLF